MLEDDLTHDPEIRQLMTNTDKSYSSDRIGSTKVTQVIRVRQGIIVWCCTAAIMLGCGSSFEQASLPATPIMTTEKPTADLDLSHVSNSVVSKTTGMKFVLIPAGDFEMGGGGDFEFSEDEFPRHRVSISQPFYLGQFEVTIAQFRQFVTSARYKTQAETDGKRWLGVHLDNSDEFKKDPNFSWRNAGFKQADNHPVVNVTWNDAKSFCAWLSRNDGVVCRLPTEAEWEYACRGGTTTAWWNGDVIESLSTIENTPDGTADQAYPNWRTIKSEDGHIFTAPVGSFKANPFGLFDMHGNVSEWCEDDLREYSKIAELTVDPIGSTEIEFIEIASRAYRGGSYYGEPTESRASKRKSQLANFPFFNRGFRVMRKQ